MRTALIGPCYVGLVFRSCFTGVGTALTCIDKNTPKAEKVKAKRFSSTKSLHPALRDGYAGARHSRSDSRRPSCLEMTFG